MGAKRIRLEESLFSDKKEACGGMGMYLHVRVDEVGAKRTMHLSGILLLANMLRLNLLYKVIVYICNTRYQHRIPLQRFTKVHYHLIICTVAFFAYEVWMIIGFSLIFVNLSQKYQWSRVNDADHVCTKKAILKFNSIPTQSGMCRPDTCSILRRTLRGTWSNELKSLIKKYSVDSKYVYFGASKRTIFLLERCDVVAGYIARYNSQSVQTMHQYV